MGIADSLLEIAKLFNYMKDARPWAEGVSDGCFVCFAIAFITSRCGVFTYKIIYQGCILARNITIPSFFHFGFFVFLSLGFTSSTYYMVVHDSEICHEIP